MVTTSQATAPTSLVELEERLSRPTSGVVEALASVDDGMIFLGIGGKMGLSLATMAKRALDEAGNSAPVWGVSRFSSSDRSIYEANGIRTIACDLVDESAVSQLPKASHVVAMTGRKFGSTGSEPMTWAMNVLVPANICRHFRGSRIVAFSTGNVYGLAPIECRGSREQDELEPVGEYAQSCVARERIYEYFSSTQQMPTALIRLNYACDLRYGVLIDLAIKVRAGEPIDLKMGWFNTIWQGDANAQTLMAFSHVASPPWVINITGTRTLSVRQVCEVFSRRFGVEARFVDCETSSSLISNTERAQATFGQPSVTESQLIDWVAEWVTRELPLLGKPTHFESRSGKF